MGWAADGAACSARQNCRCDLLERDQLARQATINDTRPLTGRVLATRFSRKKPSLYKIEGVGGRLVCGSQNNIMVRFVIRVSVKLGGQKSKNWPA